MPKSQKVESTPTRLSEIISQSLEERGMSILDLATRCDIVYEHMRRIVRGAGSPSRFVLRAICNELKLNYKELQDMVSADVIQRKYGELPLVMSQKKPSLEPLERVWDHLSEAQQQDIISMARGWAKRSRAQA